MNYFEAEEYISKLNVFGWMPGLDRIKRLLDLLENPEKKVNFIHVGGTNGKGSTSSSAKSILVQAGYKTGLFISPHLHHYLERIQIDGIPIPMEKFAEILTKILAKISIMLLQGFEQPTEFEVCTAVAFQYFYEEKVDIAVIEVGLGGAIDSTNVILPLVSILTNVSLDHMDYLGETEEEIAQVKAGIIKPKTPVITTETSKEILQIFQKRADENGSILYSIGRDILVKKESCDIYGTIFSYQFKNKSFLRLKTPLLGAHQVMNSSLAITACLLLKEDGFLISDEDIYQGLADTFWPGRLEILSNYPNVLLDAAHNLDGAKKLAAALHEVFHIGKCVFIIGMLADKQREKVLGILGNYARKIIVTKPNSPRAGDWLALATEAKKYTDDVIAYEDINVAVEQGLKSCKEDEMLCITGSIYMISEARTYLMNR
ncbi:MAG: folylpolyglutamate synthase/dihydrofolate synthase family protein [Clostridia bacterium]